jgi:fluoride exporter
MELAFNRRERLMAPMGERSLAMPVVIAIAVGGAAGALARYGLDGLIERHVVTVFPWSTFTINVTGCFLAGAAVAALVDRQEVPGWLRVGVVVGFLGAYTTFSTFSQETRDLLVEGHHALALANALGSTTVGILAVILGLTVGRSG